MDLLPELVFSTALLSSLLLFIFIIKYNLGWCFTMSLPCSPSQWCPGSDKRVSLNGSDVGIGRRAVSVELIYIEMSHVFFPATVDEINYVNCPRGSFAFLD